MSVVVVTRPLPAGWLEALDGQAEVVVGLDVERADALLCLLTERVDDALLDRAPPTQSGEQHGRRRRQHRRRCVHAAGDPRGSHPGVLTEATADLTFTLLLAAARQLPGALRDAAEGRWRRGRRTAGSAPI